MPEPSEQEQYRYLQVRLQRADAQRLKHLADTHGLSIQAALVQAINRLLEEWGDEPCNDPGSRRR